MLPAFTLRGLLIGVGLVAVSCPLITRSPVLFLFLEMPIAVAGFAIWAQGSFPKYLGVIASTIVGLSLLAFLLVPTIKSPREDGPRNACLNNLHNLGLALANYHAAHGCYPPAYLADTQGRRLVSWRVLLLPYLDNRQLYDEWKKHRDEPWNGPHNIKLSKQVLEFLHCPSDTGLATDTSYVAVVGPGTIWPGTAQVGNSQIADGVASTILLVEVANSGINWMEPRDLDFTNRAPGINSQSGLGVSSKHPAVALVLFADGRITTISDHISDADLQALLTIAGGETVRLP
jgi:hypothetical protein